MLRPASSRSSASTSCSERPASSASGVVAVHRTPGRRRRPAPRARRSRGRRASWPGPPAPARCAGGRTAAGVQRRGVGCGGRWSRSLRTSPGPPGAISCTAAPAAAPECGLPLCRRSLQSCLDRAVRVPERFRGGCPFGAPRCDGEDSPTRVVGTSTLPRPAAAARGAPPRRAGTSAAGVGQPVWRAARRAESSSAGCAPGLVVVRALAGQLGQRALDLAPDAADRDAEDALAALDAGRRSRPAR